MIKNRYTSAITDKPWWLAGGIPRHMAAAVYRAVGAESVTSSRINLANPGVYTITPFDEANDVWTATDGWSINANIDTVLVSPYVLTENTTSIVRFDGGDTGTTTRAVYGAANTVTGFYQIFFSRVTSGNEHKYYQSTIAGAKAVAGGLTAGVAAMTGGTKKCFLNGVYEGVATGSATALTTESTGIGCYRKQGPSYTNIFSGNIKAIAFYDGELTADQIVALTIAMNAL